MKILIFSFYSITNTEVPPEISFNRFLDILDKNQQKPYFAWIHVFPPHDPYLPPTPFLGRYDLTDKFKTFNEQWLTGYGENHDKKMLETFMSRYDEFIRYCDSQFEDFISHLNKKNNLDNTIIILSSDHGESFDHNFFRHGGFHLYEQLTHVPLIIREPRQKEGRVINDLTEQIDIAPTILDLAGVEVPSWLEGRSLVPLMRGKKILSKPIFSMALEHNPSRGQEITEGTLAVWEGNYKLIHYLKKNESLLFNLKQDPGELNNLFYKKAEKGQFLLKLILDNLKQANEQIRQGKYIN